MNASDPALGRAVLELATESATFIQDLDNSQKLIKGLGAALRAQNKEFEGFQNGLRKTREESGLLGKGLDKIGAAISVAAIAGAVKAWADYAGHVNDTANKLGITTDQVQELSYAAKMNGGDIDTMSKGMVKLSRNLVEGDKSTVGAIKALGLNLEDLRRMDPATAFATVGDAVAKIPNPMEQAAIMTKLFGKSGAEMLPMFKGNLQQLIGKAHELGLVLDQDLIQQGDELGDTLDTLKIAGTGVIGKVFQPMVPAIVAVLNWILKGTSLLDKLRLGVDAVGIVMGRGIAKAYEWGASIADVAASAADKLPGFMIGGGGTAKSLRGEAAHMREQAKWWNDAADAQQRQAIAAALAAESKEKHAKSAAKLTGALGDQTEAEKAADKAARRHAQAILAAESAEQAFAEAVHDTLKGWTDEGRKLFATRAEGLRDYIVAVDGAVADAEEAYRKWQDAKADTNRRLFELTTDHFSDLLLARKDYAAQASLVDVSAEEAQYRQLDLWYQRELSLLESKLDRGNEASVMAYRAALANLNAYLAKEKAAIAKDVLAEHFASVAGALADLAGKTEGSLAQTVGAMAGLATAVARTLKPTISVVDRFKAAAVNGGQAWGEFAMAAVDASVQAVAAFASIDRAASASTNAIKGATAGMQLGVSVGGPFGAVIGALAGAVYGLVATEENAHRVNAQMIDDWIKQQGGVDDLSDHLQRYGLTLAQVTQEILTYGDTHEQMIQNSLEAYDRLLKAAQGAGSAWTTMVSSWSGPLVKMSAELKDLQDQIATETDDEKLSALQAKADALRKAMAGAGADGADNFKRLVDQAQLSVYAMLKNGATTSEVFAAMGDGLQTLIDLQAQYGFELSDGQQKLLNYYGVLQKNKDIADYLAGAAAYIKNINTTLGLTKEEANAVGADLKDQYDALTARGVTQEQALLMERDALQELWQATKDGNLELDETTKTMLEQAEAAGIVGETQKDVYRQILDVLVDIKNALIGAAEAAADLQSKSTSPEGRKSPGTGVPSGTSPDPPGSGTWTPEPNPPTMHHGGMVGIGNAIRRAHSGLYVGAAALRADEVPLIAQRHEGILSAGVGMPTMKAALDMLNAGMLPGGDGGETLLPLNLSVEGEPLIKAMVKVRNRKGWRG